jgi:hypothetical protein
MRRVALIVLALAFFVSPAHAQDNDDTALYQVMDVAVDVTATNAAAARDQAIMQAQRSAFEQLLTRLGADSSMAGKLDDSVIAALVQAFEVQKEQTSAVRYIGTLTVQFKPNAVRNVLNKNGTGFSEVKSKPVVILPVISFAGRNVLWEDATPWRRAWEDSARSAGLVPIVIPPGDLDDIAVLSTTEAVSGKPESLQAIMRKYKAGNAVVAVLNVDLDHLDAKKEISADIRHYDASGKAGDQEHLTLPGAADAKALASVLADSAKQIRSGLEKNWKQSGKQPKGPAMHLPMTVPISNLADWAAIKAKLANIPTISRTNVITLARDGASIELEFHGDISQLQTALGEQGLAMEQFPGTGAWILRAGGEGVAP